MLYLSECAGDIGDCVFICGSDLVRYTIAHDLCGPVMGRRDLSTFGGVAAVEHTFKGTLVVFTDATKDIAF